MKILAYDTSNGLDAAVVENGRVLAQARHLTMGKGSDVLVPLIKQVLTKSKVSPSDLGGLAVCVGPGSFTGIRVGLVTAQILSLVWKKKVAGISSLEALARGIEGKSVGVMLDAKRGKVYAALYERAAAGFREKAAPHLTEPADFLKAHKNSEIFTNVIGLENIPGILRGNDCKAVYIAEAALERKKFGDAAKLAPLYLHPKDCNVTLKKK